MNFKISPPPFALGFFLIYESGVLFSAPAVPLVPGPDAQIGIVAAVHGTVNIGSGGAVGKVAESGMPVYLGDEVRTDEKGSLQVLLLDETVFKIGPNSAIVIDKFVYDPSDDSGEVKARVVKGVFRFVTGKIARKKPSSMQVALPIGTIGIRGTIVAGQAGDGHSLVILLGPGEKNNTGSGSGKITVGNETPDGNKEVTINKTGFGTEIDGADGAPKAPFEVPKEQLDAITGALGAEPGSGGGEGEGGESATEASGEDSAEAGESSDVLGEVQALGNEADDETTKASQINAETGGAVLDGVSTFNNLGSVSSGQFHYSDFGNAFVILVGSAGPLPGTYDLKLDIDFGARRVGGGNSTLVIMNNGVAAGNAAMPLPSQGFGSGSAPAIFNFSGHPINGTACSGVVCSATADITLYNQGGVVASSETSDVRFSSGSYVFGGSGSASQQSGLSP